MDEKLYDSLEEDGSLSDISLNSAGDLIGNINNVKYELSEFIPYYNGEVTKKDINVCKKNACRKQSKIPVLTNHPVKAKSICIKKSESSISINRKKKPSRKSSEELVRGKEDNTYLRLFHTKIGYPNGGIKEPHDTTRGTDGDLSYRTATSGSMGYLDAKTPHSASDSEKNFYINYMKNDKIVPPLNLSNRNSSVFIKSYPDSTTTSNFKSRTCQNLSKFSSTNVRNINYTINIPVLGGLGPDMYSAKDKFQQLKKRKEYGQNASNKNRLKILEGKLLNNFQIVTKNVKMLKP